MKDERDISFDMVELPSCPGKLEVPTPAEKDALDKMRGIKERVRTLKTRLNELKDSGNDEGFQEISELEKELSHLKMEWDKWEHKRQKAAKERMILLGHEKD
jgi:predicted RNase H-like nuclease (RuvC/YqgF family)